MSNSAKLATWGVLAAILFGAVVFVQMVFADSVAAADATAGRPETGIWLLVLTVVLAILIVVASVNFFMNLARVLGQRRHAHS